MPKYLQHSSITNTIPSYRNTGERGAGFGRGSFPAGTSRVSPPAPPCDGYARVPVPGSRDGLASVRLGPSGSGGHGAHEQRCGALRGGQEGGSGAVCRAHRAHSLSGQAARGRADQVQARGWDAWDVARGWGAACEGRRWRAPPAVAHPRACGRCAGAGAAERAWRSGRGCAWDAAVKRASRVRRQGRQGCGHGRPASCRWRPRGDVLHLCQFSHGQCGDARAPQGPPAAHGHQTVTQITQQFSIDSANGSISGSSQDLQLIYHLCDGCADLLRQTFCASL